MATKNRVTEWKQLREAPSSMADGIITTISPSQFILATYWIGETNEKIIDGLYMYDNDKDEWTLWLKYPQEWQEVWSHKFMLDSKRSIAYLWHKIELNKPGRFQKINLETKEYETIKDAAIEANVIEREVVNLQDEIHLIGGYGTRHVKFDKNTEKFQEIHTFDSFEKMIAPLMVYIASKDVILICGGETTDNKCDVGVREFSLKTRKWRKVEEVSYNYSGGDALLTKDEKHVILIPSENEDEEPMDYGVIFILDIMDDGRYGLRKSNVQMPVPEVNAFDYDVSIGLLGSCKGDSDKLLLCGFVKKVFNYGDEWMIVSDDVINLIVMFYQYEMMHVIKRDIPKSVNEHWIIDVPIVVSES